MNHERMLADLDKDVDAARRTLDQLITARAAFAAAHGLTGRKAVSSTNGEPVNGSLMSVALRVMKDGAWWNLDDVLAAVLAERSTSRSTVNTTLARGALDGGPFERGPRKGTYRIRPAVVAGWTEKEAPAAA